MDPERHEVADLPLAPTLASSSFTETPTLPSHPPSCLCWVPLPYLLLELSGPLAS